METEDSVTKLYIDKCIDDKGEILKQELFKELTSLRESIKTLAEKNTALERQVCMGTLSNLLRVAQHNIHVTGHLPPAPHLIMNVSPCEEEIRKYIAIAQEKARNMTTSSDMDNLIASVLNKINQSLTRFGFNNVFPVSE